MSVVAMVVGEPSVVCDRATATLNGRGVACSRRASLGDLLAEDVASADLVILDTEACRLRPSVEELLALRESPNEPQVLVLTSVEGPDERERLSRAGCTVLPVQIEEDVLQQVLLVVLGRRAPAATSAPPAARECDGPQLLDFESSSPVMQPFLKTVRRITASDSSLLILGETGVGKEWLARGIHRGGRRVTGPFVAVNCGAFPEALLESELFGHERGAFTGAVKTRKGWFEVADGGTLFLDEIGEMPLHLQVKLLRVLQEREVVRVGGEAVRRVDVRVFAATNRDLELEIAAGRFRSDLYYRLNVLSVEVPPLRRRTEDIPALARRILADLRPGLGGSVIGLSDEALASLSAYAWPGNVRELANVIERAMILAEGEWVGPDELPETIRFAEKLDEVSPPSPAQTVEGLVEAFRSEPLPVARRAAVAAFEKAYLEFHLRETGGRVGETARRAGIRPRSLFERMKHYGLRKEAFRRPESSREP